MDEHVYALRTVSPKLAVRVIDEAKRLREPGREGKRSVSGRLGRVLTTSIPTEYGSGVEREALTSCQIAKREIDRYKIGAEEAIRKFHAISLEDIGYGAVVVVLLVLGLFFADFNGKLVSAGLSGVTAFAKVQDIIKAHQKFVQDRFTLRNSESWLEGKLDECKDEDSCCDAVSSLALESLKELGKSGQAEQSA